MEPPRDPDPRSLASAGQESGPVGAGAGEPESAALTPEDRRYAWQALSVTTVGALLAATQGSALLIAIPRLMTALHADFLTIMWIILGYQLVTTAAVPMIGRAADLIGRKTLYNIGFAIFGLGSLWAALAIPSFHGWDLVGARLVQGLGGALLFTNSTAIVTDAFRKERTGLGLGVNQVALGAGFVLGPVVGGVLTALSWRWVFGFNVPLAVFGTLWGMARLREPLARQGHEPFDWAGGIVFTLGLGAFLMALTVLGFPLVPSWVAWLLLALSAILLPLYVLVEGRVTSPTVDFKLFGDRLFSFACVALVLNTLARGAILFVLIFFLQGPYGQDPLTAGLMLAPFGVVFMLTGPMAGWLSDRIGSRILATAGLVVSAGALVGLSSLRADTPYWILASFLILEGAGSGFFGTPNTSAIMTSVPPERRGVASAVRVVLNNTGQMVAIALAFPLAIAKIPAREMMRIFLVGGGVATAPAALRSFESGMTHIFWLSAGVLVVAAFISALRPSRTWGEAKG